MGLVAPLHVGSSQTRAQTHVPCIGRWILNHCATREAPSSLSSETDFQGGGFSQFPRLQREGEWNKQHSPLLHLVLKLGLIFMTSLLYTLPDSPHPYPIVWLVLPACTWLHQHAPSWSELPITMTLSYHGCFNCSFWQ